MDASRAFPIMLLTSVAGLSGLDVADLTGRLERSLERQLELESLLDKLRESDPITGVPGSFTADLEAAREICEVVEAMIGGRNGRGTTGDFRSAICDCRFTDRSLAPTRRSLASEPYLLPTLSP
jgi:hypothetical protein